MEYNEEEAIKYMRSHVPSAEAYDDDQLLNLIDIIFDWYEESGDLEIDADDDDEDIAAIAAHASKLLAKDPGNVIRPEHVAPLIAAEVEYEMSLI
ncbi:MAG: hypothetical protein K2L21_01410 [Muribaculaceae bacterium]|nr:hypothetical protein [Muribaculaceae bacterium]